MRRFITAAVAGLTLFAWATAPVANADIIQPAPTPYQAQYVNVASPGLGLAPFTVVATGYVPGQQIFVEQCDGNAPTVPNWDPTINCDSASSPSPVPADSTGTVFFNASSPTHHFTPFKGASPQANFNCNGLDDPPLAGSNSLPDFNNCQVRVSSNNAASTNDQQLFGVVVPDNPSAARVASFKVPSHPSQGLNPLTVTASGFTPGQQVFVEQCDGVPTTASGWDPTINCDSASSPSPLPADSSGSVTFDAASANHKFIPFRGTSPQGNFNCLAPADPPSTNGLLDYTNCRIRVSSNNAASTSDQRFFGLTVPAGVPDAPTIGTASETSGGGIVAFAPGPDNGYPVSGFTTSCLSSNGGAAGSASNPSSPITVSGLTNGRTYACSVTATNGAGTSQPSSASNSFVHALVPDAPTGATANAGNRSVQIVFTTPTFNGPPFDNGGTVTSVTAWCASTDGGNSGSQSGALSPILVTGLDNGKTYTCTIDATNAIGTGAESAPTNAVVPDTVPDAPTIGVATRGDSSASVTFTPGFDEGSPITSFAVTCTSSDGGATRSATGVASPISVAGLDNGNTYTCAVRATSSVGTGPQSPDSNSFIPARAPDAPTGVVAVRGNASLQVAFTPGFDGGRPAQYDVSCSSSGSGGPGSAPNQSGSPVTVSSLTNGQSYTCTVTAHNEVGSGAASALSNAVTPGAVPNAPTAVVASRNGSGSLSVAFSPGNNNGFVISSFSARCSSTDIGAASPVAASGAASPISVNGLTNGDTYSCTVNATNAIGTGASSAASNSIIPATVPSAPTIGVVTRSGGGIRVPFTAGTSNGLPITSFTATCSSTSTGATTGSASSSASPIVVSGVTLGRTYTCVVTATNGVGTGPASSPSNSIVPAVAPAAPTAVTVVSGSDPTPSVPMKVSFTVGSGHGSPITDNTATCTSSNGGVTQTGSSATSPVSVSATTIGKTYTCTVTSTNAVGTGPASSSSAVVVEGSPAAPTSVVARSLSTTHSTGSLRVTFTPGASNGSPVTDPKYTTTCTSANGGVSKTVIGATTTLTVAGVTTAKSYTCTVTAHNARGFGLPGASLPVIVGSPAAPSTPTVSNPASGTRRVTFPLLAAAQDNGSPLTSPNYTATCASSDGGVTKSATGSASPINVPLLTAGKTYTCTVKAHNARGYGLSSPPSGALTA